MYCIAHIRRTILHAGANEIIVRDRTPAPLLGAGAPPNSLCDNAEDVVNSFILLSHSSRPACPHDLWLVLDLDGDGKNGYEHSNGDSAWKSYDRFTLRVSWPASVSPPLPYTTPLLLLSNVHFIFQKKVSCTGRAQLASPRHIVCCSFLRPHGHHDTAASPSRADPS